MRDTVKIDRFKTALAESEFDVVVAASPENTWYLTGVIIESQRILPERLAPVVWGKEYDPVHIICANEETQVRKDAWIRDIRSYIEFREEPMQLVGQVITEQGAAKGKVGIEKRFLGVHYYEELIRLLPHVQFVEAGSFFDRLRAIKTPDEVRTMESGAQVTDRAIWKTFESIQPGMTEKQVGIRLSSELILGGAEAQTHQVFAAGTNSFHTHPLAGDYVLKDGDLFRTDFGGFFKGYRSDISRTACVGKPSQRQMDTYKFVWEEHEKLIAMSRPGVTGRELYEWHERVWREKGWSMRFAHCGHNLGIGVHENPMLRPGDNTPLQPGMCVVIEINHAVPTAELYHLEDLILITESGSRILSRTADWTHLFAAGV